MLATETCIVAAVRNQPQNIADVRVTRPSRTRWRPAASMTRDGSQNSTFSLRSFISRPSRAVSQERRTIGDCVDRLGDGAISRDLQRFFRLRAFFRCCSRSPLTELPPPQSRRYAKWIQGHDGVLGAVQVGLCGDGYVAPPFTLAKGEGFIERCLKPVHCACKIALLPGVDDGARSLGLEFESVDKIPDRLGNMRSPPFLRRFPPRNGDGAVKRRIEISFGRRPNASNRPGCRPSCPHGRSPSARGRARIALSAQLARSRFVIMRVPFP
jgi:hypothetical protein